MILHEVITTEKVPFSYRVAGQGSRFLAWLVDAVLMVLLIVAGAMIGNVLELGRASRGQFEVTCLRLATVFGLSPRMRFDLAVNVMTKNAYVNRRITVDGGGRQWRPFVHVRDVAHAFELALTAGQSQALRGRALLCGGASASMRAWM